MKKEYMKPTMRVVLLRHRSQIICGSSYTVTGINSNLDEEDDDEFYLGDGDTREGR